MQVMYACNYVCYDYITIYVDLASCSLDTPTSVISMYFDSSRASQLEPPRPLFKHRQVSMDFYSPLTFVIYFSLGNLYSDILLFARSLHVCLLLFNHLFSYENIHVMIPTFGALLVLYVLNLYSSQLWPFSRVPM